MTIAQLGRRSYKKPAAGAFAPVAGFNLYFVFHSDRIVTETSCACALLSSLKAAAQSLLHKLPPASARRFRSDAHRRL